MRRWLQPRFAWLKIMPVCLYFILFFILLDVILLHHLMQMLAIKILPNRTPVQRIATVHFSSKGPLPRFKGAGRGRGQIGGTLNAQTNVCSRRTMPNFVGITQGLECFIVTHLETYVSMETEIIRVLELSCALVYVNYMLPMHCYFNLVERN